MALTMITAPRSARVLLQYWKLGTISAFSLAVAMAVGVLGLSVVKRF